MVQSTHTHARTTYINMRYKVHVFYCISLFRSALVGHSDPVTFRTSQKYEIMLKIFLEMEAALLLVACDTNKTNKRQPSSQLAAP